MKQIGFIFKFKSMDFRRGVQIFGRLVALDTARWQFRAADTDYVFISYPTILDFPEPFLTHSRRQIYTSNTTNLSSPHTHIPPPSHNPPFSSLYLSNNSLAWTN